MHSSASGGPRSMYSSSVRPEKLPPCRVVATSLSTAGCRLLGMRLDKVYDVDSRTYLLKLGRCVLWWTHRAARCHKGPEQW